MPVVIIVIGCALESAAQTIRSVSPNPAPVGATISIAGTGFGASGAGSELTANGASYAYSTWSNTLITAVVPSNANLGSYSVGVTVNGMASNVETLAVVGDPVITSLSPNPAAPGATVTIAGSNFGASSSTSELTFQGSSFAWATWNNTAITAEVPVGTPPSVGAVAVTVGGIASNTMTETIVPVAQVTGVSPSPVSVGSTVTVSGSDFGSSQGASTLTYDGNVYPTSTWSANAITAMVSTGSQSGTGNVGVTVGGVASNTVNLTVNNNPNIVLSPSTGPPGMGILIDEYNIGSEGTPTVTFNGTPVEIVTSTSSSLTIQVPANATINTNPTVVVTYGSTSAQATFAVIGLQGCTGT